MQVTPLGINFAIFLHNAGVDAYPEPKETKEQPKKPKKITFKGYNSPLKKAFLKGALGDEFIGIYGNKLDKTNYSIEHIIPISKGGTNDLSNQFLADRTANSKRGVEDIGKFVTIEMLRKYLKRFKDVVTPYFDGNAYIKGIKKTFSHLVDD